jgi:signal transduction histidine kinase
MNEVYRQHGSDRLPPATTRRADVVPNDHQIVDALDLACALPHRLEDHDVMRLATLGLMTAGVAHDLGNHLQVIASALNLIQRPLEESNRQDLHTLAQSAQTSVDRAAAPFRQILDVAA